MKKKELEHIPVLDNLLAQSLKYIHMALNVLVKHAPQKKLALLSFVSGHYREGMEELCQAPALPSETRALSQYIEELWQLVSFDPSKAWEDIQKANGETLIQKPPEVAREILKSRLDTFIRQIERKEELAIASGSERERAYTSIERYVRATFHALIQTKNKEQITRTLLECIEAYGHCIMRYLEVSRNLYVTVCLGKRQTGKNLLFSLAADMRNRSAQEIVTELYQSDVHVFNIIKKDLGEKLGLPGWQDCIHDDIYGVIAREMLYSPERVEKLFLEKYTPKAFVLNYLFTRLQAEPEELSAYMRLYEELFPVTDEQLPRFMEYRQMMSLGIPEAFVRKYSQISPERSPMETCERVERLLASCIQARKTFESDFCERHAVSLPLPASASEELRTEWSLGIRSVEKQLSLPIDEAVQVYQEILAVKKLPSQDQGRHLQQLFDRYPKLFACTKKTDQQVTEEILAEERQDVLYERVTEEHEGVFQLREGPLIDVLQNVGILNWDEALLDVLAAPNALNVDGQTPLIRAIEQLRDPSYIEVLVKGGANLNVQNIAGMTPLGYALTLALSLPANGRFLEIANTICMLGADITTPDVRRSLSQFNEFGRNLSTHCISTGLSPELLLLLKKIGVDFESPDRDGWTAATLAVHLKKPEMVRALHAVGVSFSEEVVERVISDNNASMIHVLQEVGVDFNRSDSHGHTAATCAVYWQKPEIVRALHAAGVSFDVIDRQGNTPVTLAVDMDDLAMIPVLREVGANLDKRNFRGWTAATRAVHLRNPEMVRALYAAGANFACSKKGGRTPVTLAVEMEQVPMIHVLKDIGVPLDGRDGLGWTAATLAVYSEKSEMVRVLHAVGADFQATNGAEKTPLSTASELGESSMIDLLRELGVSI